MIVSWNVTKACNLNCKHCYRDAGKKDPSELNTKEAKELIKEISKSKFKIVVFSGGEPLLREDIYELISFSSKCGLRPVLGTNGTLINKDVAKRLKKAGLGCAGISLDSLNPEIHDEFRQKEGTWNKVLEAMKNCKDEGLRFQVHTTVLKINFKEITEITDFASELGASSHHIFFLVPTGRGREICDSSLSLTEYKMLLKKILEKQKETNIELKPVCAPQFLPLSKRLGINMSFERGCICGISYCCILPNGDIYPCPYLPVKIGNIREDKFSLIWQKGEILNRLRSLNYKGRCSICEYRISCGGCRARAFYYSGDYMAEDPNCIFKC
ncbi:MAG: putative heme d1 biosynthesis radical SAM protein NirJ2 [Candidatus Omnitrophica bacterium]|nr:putative heme d1 biosynthesis radical SAM protein NirJ2 [Candidatus Omnitrophota bacterium]